MTTMKCPYCAEEIQAEAIKCKHCGTWLSAPPEGGVPYQPAYHAGVTSAPVVLTRSSTNRMIFGVCGGLAHYMGVDATLVRIVVAVATFFTAIVPGIVLYTILGLVMPSDDAPRY